MRSKGIADRLLKQNILITRGIKKGTEFLINPRLITNAKLNIQTTLKTVEPYALEALIKEDLRIHPNSKISDISKRLPDVELKDIRKFVYTMVGKGILITGGSNKNRVYRLVDE